MWTVGQGSAPYGGGRSDLLKDNGSPGGIAEVKNWERPSRFTGADTPGEGLECRRPGMKIKDPVGKKRMSRDPSYVTDMNQSRTKEVVLVLSCGCGVEGKRGVLEIIVHRPPTTDSPPQTPWLMIVIVPGTSCCGLSTSDRDPSHRHQWLAREIHPKRPQQLLTGREGNVKRRAACKGFNPQKPRPNALHCILHVIAKLLKRICMW